MLESVMLVHRSRIDRLVVLARVIFSSPAVFKREALFCGFVFAAFCAQPVWGRGTPLPLVHLLPHLFPLLLFSVFHWLYLFSSFVHPFPLYQNSPTPFPGRMS